MAYSSPKDILAFKDKLLNGVEGDLRHNGVTPTRRPMWVLDMDGNVAVGYNLAAGENLPLGASDDPKTQAIPSGADIDRLLKDGIVEEAIFSVKPMDSRLPKPLVESLNAARKDGRDYDIVLLTSRNTADTMRILELSGVEHPDKTTLIGDSGAVMRIAGKETITRALQPQEKDFLNRLEQGDIAKQLENAVDGVLKAYGLSSENRPALHFEPKGIAKNVHYGAILKTFGEKEDSTLDVSLSKALRDELESFITQSAPKDDGKPVFKLLEGPTTLEVKIASVDKGKGLEAALNAALESGYRPSSVIFAGDDVAKKHPDGNVSHGTDFAAFAAAPAITEKTGIPVHTIHTQHPINGYPNPSKDAIGVKPDIILPTPKDTGALVVHMVNKALERGKSIDESARNRAASSPPSGKMR